MNFSLIGASGYIASRHIDAIYNLGGNIVSYHDINRNDELEKKGVAFIESQEAFFKDLKHQNADFCVICCPNFLHYKMIYQSIKTGTDVICEKPLCLNKKDFDELKRISNENNVNVFSIMQLRLHPVMEQLKKIAYEVTHSDTIKKSVIKFITPRDKDYLNSWKTDEKLSGGIIFNLGIHYFDLLIQAFGSPITSNVQFKNELEAKGTTNFENLEVDWIFSIFHSESENKLKPERIFMVDNQQINFSKVDNDLHQENYQEIIEDKNFSLSHVEDTMNFIFSLNNYNSEDRK